MAKAAQLLSIFFAACAANSLLNWVARATQTGGKAAKLFYAIVLILLIASVLLDDGVRMYLKLNPAQYYASIAGIALSVLIGGGIIWMIG